MESFSAAGQANRDAACVYVECTENTSQRINRRVEVFGPMPQPLGVQQWVYFFFFQRSHFSPREYSCIQISFSLSPRRIVAEGASEGIE